jgi:prefoldin subunit 5
LEGPIPDALQSLEQLLRLFVSPRDAQAIITFLQPYGPDNIPKLWEALGNLNVPLNRRRMIIEAWCVSRNLPLPEPLKREIGITPMPTFTPSFGFAPETKQEDLFDKLLKWEMLKAQQQSNSNDLKSLENELQAYKEELSRLREELHKRELEVYEKDIQHLNSAIEDLKRQIENARLATSDFAVLIKEVKDLGEKWIKFSGGPLVELLMNSLGYVKVPSEKLITKETEEAEQSLLSLFEKRGWVVEG